MSKYTEPCGRTIEYGPRHDPYGTDCELAAGHTGPHEGPDPLGEPGDRLRWEGGGYAAGDPLPVRNLTRVQGSEADREGD